MLAGGLALFKLPVSMYPNVAPPAVEISATYPGASAKVVEDSLVQRPGHHHPDLRERHHPGHRPGAGAEQGIAGHATPAFGSDPAGRGGGQGQRRLPDGGGTAVRYTDHQP
ncbi:hypothetical protein G6F24_014793 [Rhizopus arrhizus]|nr:hypothetical protein G6F24_014793 [Rhizopus arrhizus]